MTNNRQKGKRIERQFCAAVRHIFPNIRRNANGQSQMGGVDVLETDPFDFEIKGGHAYKSRMIRDIIDQVENEGNPNNFKAAYVHPDHEDPYFIVPADDFIELLELCKNEGIIK